MIYQEIKLIKSKHLWIRGLDGKKEGKREGGRIVPRLTRSMRSPVTQISPSSPPLSYSLVLICFDAHAQCLRMAKDDV